MNCLTIQSPSSSKRLPAAVGPSARVMMCPSWRGGGLWITDGDAQVPHATVQDRLPSDDAPTECPGCVFEHVPDPGALACPPGTQCRRRAPLDVEPFDDGGFWH